MLKTVSFVLLFILKWIHPINKRKSKKIAIGNAKAFESILGINLKRHNISLSSLSLYHRPMMISKNENRYSN